MKSNGWRFTSWEKAAVVVGAVGWAWVLVQILGMVLAMERDDGPPYPVGQLGDAFAGVEPVDREIFGPVADRIHGRSICDRMWFDEDAVLIRGIGPMNGSTAPAWLTLTVGSQVFVGRVTVDLWNGVGAGTGGLESSTNYIIATNLRFVERVPPPRPGPPGWRVIRPGECVLGSTEPQDASGVIGQFLIDLPAGKSVGVRWSTDLGGDYVPITDKLTFEGKDLREVRIEQVNDDRYLTQNDGRYELTVRRTDSSDAGHAFRERSRPYTVYVAWGAWITSACAPPRPSFDCFMEVQP